MSYLVKLHRLAISISMALFIALSIYSLYIAPAARTAVSYVIVIDLAHGESPKGLDIFAKTLYDAEIYLLLSSDKDIARLDPVTRNLVSGYLFGTLDNMKTQDGRTVTLNSLLTDLLIIPQPTVDFTQQEIEAIKSYLGTRMKAIWLAGDSDYPPGETTIAIVNKILEAVGSNLALDYVSVEDPVSNAKAPYRVIASVRLSQNLSFLGFGAERILMHGPGVIAFRDLATGSWGAIKPDSVPKGIEVIVWTSPEGKIVENTAPPKGLLGQAYNAGDKGIFPMVAAQYLPNLNNSLVILSSETPLGGYQPMITAEYYGIMLDGPRFVRNIVLWATGYMGELKYVVAMDKRIRDAEANISNLLSTVRGLMPRFEDLSSRVNQLGNQVSQASSNINDLSTRISNFEKRINDLSNTLSNIDARASGSQNIAYIALGIAIVGIAAAIISIVRR